MVYFACPVRPGGATGLLEQTGAPNHHRGMSTTMARRMTSKTASGRQGLVYGYCGVSSQEQASNGIRLDEQKRRIEGRCHERGWSLAELFVEAGVSGSIPFAQRPQGSRL